MRNKAFTCLAAKSGSGHAMAVVQYLQSEYNVAII